MNGFHPAQETSPSSAVMGDMGGFLVEASARAKAQKWEITGCFGNCKHSRAHAGGGVEGRRCVSDQSGVSLMPYKVGGPHAEGL